MNMIQDARDEFNWGRLADSNGAVRIIAMKRTGFRWRYWIPAFAVMTVFFLGLDSGLSRNDGVILEDY